MIRWFILQKESKYDKRIPLHNACLNGCKNFVNLIIDEAKAIDRAIGKKKEGRNLSNKD